MPLIHTSTTTSDDLIISESSYTNPHESTVLIDDVAFDQHEYNALDLAHPEHGIQFNSMLCANLEEHPLSINPYEVRSWCV